MKKTVKTADRGDQTRSALVQAALAAFSEKGFHGVSTRENAGTAQVNQALIGYHFGNKEGLYLAVFAYLCEQIQSRVDPFAGQIEARLHALQGKELPREESIALLLRLLEGLATLFTNPQSNPWAKLILSEQQSPTRAFDLLYERFMGRYMALMVELTRRIRPQDDTEQLRLCVATILGQMLVFRAAPASIFRLLAWDSVNPQQLEAILRQLRRNVRAVLDAQE